MDELIISNEKILRPAFFLGVFLVVGILEYLFPRRGRTIGRVERWVPNLILIFIGSFVVKFVCIVTPVAFAQYCHSHSIGFLNVIVIPKWGRILFAIIIFDMIIYFQHLVFHKWNWLWRLHKVHHCDLDLDVSSGIRFHPIEILISIGVKMVSVFIIGPDPVAVILFEVLLNASAQFNHGNLKIPESIEKYLRLFIVTPDFHITHHSVEPKETNSNYGFMLTWWDYLFKSYIRCPGAGYEEMTIGLKQYRDIKKLKIVNLLLMPFK